MIVDTTSQLALYAALDPRFATAAAFFQVVDLASLGPGRHEIAGDDLFLLVSGGEGRGRDGAPLEAHKHCIDIHITIEGVDEIGWKPVALCEGATAAYDSAADVLFFAETPISYCSIPAGTFAICFPGDAHAPLSSTGIVKKAVVKIKVVN